MQYRSFVLSAIIYLVFLTHLFLGEYFLGAQTVIPFSKILSGYGLVSVL